MSCSIIMVRVIVPFGSRVKKNMLRHPSLLRDSTRLSCAKERLRELGLAFLLFSSCVDPTRHPRAKGCLRGKCPNRTVHDYYGEREKEEPVKYKFEVGDQVRIGKMKRTFEKGYLPNFSKEIFTVSQQIPRQPSVYKLKDYDQEELSRTFYNEELQKVIKEDDVYEVEKILKKRGKGKNKEVYVKWLGYPTKFNSWIPASEVKDI